MADLTDLTDLTDLIVTDASVIIGWLDSGDVHHRRAIEVLATVERFIVHPLTLAEVLVHPTRQGRAGTVTALLESIGMVVSTLPLDPLTLAHHRVASGLKMPDVVVAVCAIEHAAELRTFDAQLAAYVHSLRQ